MTNEQNLVCRSFRHDERNDDNGEAVPVPARQMSPAATLAAHLAFRQGRGVKVSLSPTDGGTREPRDLADCLQTTPSSRADLASREHPPPALIELRADALPSLPNPLRIDHADTHTAEVSPQESRCPESNCHRAPARYPIHLLWRVSLLFEVSLGSDRVRMRRM